MPVCPCPAFVLTTSNLLTSTFQRPIPPTNDPAHDVSIGKGQGQENPSRSETKIKIPGLLSIYLFIGISIFSLSAL